ncbi:MAG: glycosyltransferase [Bryobacteraceae bacterium]
MKTAEASAISCTAAGIESPRDGRIGVGVLIFTAGYGGADTIVLNWLQVLDRDRFRPYLFAFDTAGGHEGNRFFQCAAEAGFDVHALPWNRRKPLFRAARTLADYIRRFHIEVLHCHNPYANFVGALTKRYVPVTIINTFHAWDEPGIRVQVLERLDVQVSRFFDQITTPSEAAKRGALDRGIPANRVKVLRVCSFSQAVRLSSVERDARRLALGAAPDDVVLVSVARFYRVKRYDIMLQAFRRVMEGAPKVRLWMLGDGPEEESMRRLADALGVADRVRFLGYRADVADVLALSDIQLLTSDVEGLPMAIIEGMMSGLPIVSTAVGSIPEVLTHRESGMLVNTGSPGEVAEAALELVRNGTRRRALGAAARRIFETHFSPAAGAASVGGLYEGLVRR